MIKINRVGPEFDHILDAIRTYDRLYLVESDKDENSIAELEDCWSARREKGNEP
jgi:hypothetical protein